MTVLVIAEHDNTALKGATFNTITAARELSLFGNGEVHVLITGNSANAAVDAAAQISGVSKVLYADAEWLSRGCRRANTMHRSAVHPYPVSIHC